MSRNRWCTLSCATTNGGAEGLLINWVLGLRAMLGRHEERRIRGV